MSIRQRLDKEEKNMEISKRLSAIAKMVKKGVLKLTKAPLKTVKIPSGNHSLVKNHESFYEMGKANFMIKEIDK